MTFKACNYIIQRIFLAVYFKDVCAAAAFLSQAPHRVYKVFVQDIGYLNIVYNKFFPSFNEIFWEDIDLFDKNGFMVSQNFLLSVILGKSRFS